MRKNLKEIHSVSTQEYIQLIQAVWNKDLFYNKCNLKISTQNIENFYFGDRESNVSINKLVNIDGIKIHVMDAENETQSIFDYCCQECHQKKHVDYVLKIEVNNNNILHNIFE